MYFSEAAAGLLGIGTGIFKVSAMDQVMRMPFKGPIATSNFMIGIIAVSGIVAYFAGGREAPWTCTRRLTGHCRRNSIREGSDANQDNQ